MATAALVDRDELRDLGEHRLKDLSAPRQDFVLSVCGPLEELTPSRTPWRRRTNLLAECRMKRQPFV
jgi:hypothetical protein